MSVLHLIHDVAKLPSNACLVLQGDCGEFLSSLCSADGRGR